MQVSTYASDVQILPETPEERTAIIKWAKLRNIYGTVNFQSIISNVEGQDWFGKRFYEIPFGKHGMYSDLLEWLADNLPNKKEEKVFHVVGWDTREIISTHNSLGKAKRECRKLGHDGDTSPILKSYPPIAFVSNDKMELVYNPRFSFEK